jgi:hypothetical protein
MAEVHGNRTSAENARKTGALAESGAENGARGAQEALIAPDLVVVVEAWPPLPATIRAAILAMVRVSSGAD